MNPTIRKISRIISLPLDTVLDEYDPSLKLVGQRLLSSLATLSGYLRFSVLNFDLEELYVSIDTPWT